MFAYIKNNQITASTSGTDPFGISVDGTFYPQHCPIGVEGVNYPANCSKSTLESLGFKEIVTVGEHLENSYYWNGDSLTLVNGIPTRTLSSTPRSLAEMKRVKLSALATKRYQTEISGFTVDGLKIATDDRSKSLINGAYALVQQVPSTTVNWKTDAGFVSLSAAQITAIAVAVGQFVQTCFSTEAAHMAAIEALTDASAVIAYDITTGWPE